MFALDTYGRKNQYDMIFVGLLLGLHFGHVDVHVDVRTYTYNNFFFHSISDHNVHYTINIQNKSEFEPKEQRSKYKEQISINAGY